MKFALCSEIFEGLSPADVVARIADAGYDGIEVAPALFGGDVTRVSARTREEFRAEVARRGLMVSAVHWLLAGHRDLHLTTRDADVRRRTSGYLSAVIDFCADIGGRHVVFGSPEQRRVAAGVGAEQAWAYACEALRPVLARAEARNVFFCVEPLAPAVTNFLNTADDASEFAGALDSPMARVMLDVFAMQSEGEAAANIIRRIGARLGYFHANDTNGRGPGRGQAAYAEIVAALREVGYDGWVSVEVFDFAEGGDAIARASRAFLRQAFGV